MGGKTHTSLPSPRHLGEARLCLEALRACGGAAGTLRQCSWLRNNAPPSGDAASGGQAPGKPGDLHDCRIPPDKQRQGLIKLMPGTSGGSETTAASHKELCTWDRFEGTRDVGVLDHAKTL